MGGTHEVSHSGACHVFAGALDLRRTFRSHRHTRTVDSGAYKTNHRRAEVHA